MQTVTSRISLPQVLPIEPEVGRLGYLPDMPTFSALEVDQFSPDRDLGGIRRLATNGTGRVGFPTARTSLKALRLGHSQIVPTLLRETRCQNRVKTVVLCRRRQRVSQSVGQVSACVGTVAAAEDETAHLSKVGAPTENPENGRARSSRPTQDLTMPEVAVRHRSTLSARAPSGRRGCCKGVR